MSISYDRIVHRLYESSNPERQVAEKLLGWMVCAKRPLKWYEIQGAVSVGLNDRSYNFDERRLRVDLKDICGSLAQMHSEGTVELVHPTARL